MGGRAVILDTNFIIACVKKKVDFLEMLRYKGYVIIIPKQIIKELEKIHSSRQSITQRNYAHLALEILKKHQREFESVDIKERYVDKGILEYMKAHPQIKVATLDRALKEKLKKLGVPLITIRKTGRIE